MRRSRISLLCCTVVALCCVVGPATAQDQQAPIIRELRVDGLRRVAKQTVLDAVKDILAVGKPFEAAQAPAAQDALMGTGLFVRVTVSADPTVKETAVVIAVIEKVKIRRIFFVGNTLLTTAQLEPVVKSRSGDLPDDNVLRQDVRRVEECYAAKGSIGHVSGFLNDGSGGTYVFVIQEATIEALQFVGLERTKPETVQGQLTLKAGVPFDELGLSRDLQKLYNLGLFDKVTSDIQPGKDDPFGGIIVVITFVEKPAN